MNTDEEETREGEGGGRWGFMVMLSIRLERMFCKEDWREKGMKNMQKRIALTGYPLFRWQRQQVRLNRK